MEKIDTTCEHIKIRLVAAAVGLQECTKTAANVIPLPGTGRFITIGTPAEVVMLLRQQVPDRRPIIGEGDGAALGEWMTQGILHDETTLPEDVAALFGACGFEIRSTDPAEKHPLAVCGSLDAAGLVVEKVLTELLPDATDEMLDMLGRIEPLAMLEQQGAGQWFERLCRARAIQQPLPVPDQAAVVWRSDLVRAVAELIQLRAYRDHLRAERARKVMAEQRPVDREGGAA